MMRFGCGAAGVLLVVVTACSGDESPGGTPDAPGGGGGGGCSAVQDTCTGETVCVSGSCVAAFPRVYAISAINIALPTTNQGATWDVGGGAPDPFAVISVNGTMAATTSAVQDVFTATLPGPWNITINAAGSTLLVDIFDEDATVDDHAFACTGTLTAALARARTLACGTTVTYKIEPR